MVNQQESTSHSIRTLPLRQRVFVGFLFLLALILSVLILRYVDPSTAVIHPGSVDHQPLTSLQPVVLG
jgi:hypothetical protein